jgi:ferritin-like metal-binding protein YciE
MTLHEMLIDELKDLYHAEKQLTKALPKMAKASTNEDLREAFEAHLEETQEQVTRLEQVFESLDEKVKAKPCPGMAGIIEEGSEKLQELDEGPVLDAALIAGAQRAEHYEITAYGTCIEWARLMGHNEAVALLEQTLAEEKAADKKLTMLAEQGINEAAFAEGSEEGDEEEEGAKVHQATGSGSQRQAVGNTKSRAKAAERSKR